MKSKRFISLSLMFGLTAGLFVSLKANTNASTIELVQADSVSDYYSGISDTLTGDALKEALHSLNSSKRKKTIGYDNLRYFFANSDKDPDGSGKIVGFYDNQLVGPNWDSGKTWNREHIWPNSRGGGTVDGDAHMTRPAATSTNSDRGSKGYSELAYDPGQYVAYYRGAASRIIFYAAITNTSLEIIENPIPYDRVGDYDHHMGCLSEMLAWNLAYQPSDTSFTGADDLARRTEISRNNYIHQNSSGQGNRNPFIDHPEYACKIWGNTNSATRTVCGLTPVDPSVSISKTSATLEVGATTTISASSSDNSQITWSTSNSSVASLSASTSASGSSITLTAAGAGSATITAKATISGTEYSKTCSVTVNGGAEIESISLNVTEKTLKPSDRVQLRVIVNPSDAKRPTFVWSSTNEAVASVDANGLVTATGIGDCEIVVKTSDNKFSDKCVIHVNNGSAPSGCGGNVVATSVILSTLSLLGVGILLIKRKFIK